jgi:hypothetical protein
MPDDRDLTVQELFERQRLYRQDPWKIYPIFLPPCRVRILMVTDGGGSFGMADFGLKTLLDILNVSPGPWVRFEVTKAHRRTDPDADLQNFLFDNHDLSQYDQIWMFAVERSGSPILTDSELRAVSEFMDGGGGVFATGDHEDLGVAMCGRVPRVRSMRKWYWPNPGPNGEPVAPAVGGPNRYDTLSEGNDPGIQFNDQSDDIPQRITPRLYSSWSWLKWFHRVYPHPLLCGPRGIIRVLPDHPHEGECYEPSDLSASFTFSGYTITEYPAGLSPEVIAWSTIAGRMIDANKGPLNPRTFGAIGAYDGHRVDVGRAVVDATWHHFFNINLIGELGNPDPIKGVGFDATTTGHAAYEDIKSYYRNIAVWLARPASQACMWWRMLWWLRWHHILVMDLRPQYLEAPDRLDLGELLRLGGEARDVLGRIASQCTLLVWFGWQVLRPLRREMWDQLGQYLDPWRPGPAERARPGQEPVPDFAVAAQAELLLDASLGGLVYAVAQAFPEPNEDARLRAQEMDWSQLVGAHLDRTIDVLAEHLDQTSERIRGFRDVLVRRDGDQPTG